MTLFLGASPSYVREGGAKPNVSWRDGECRHLRLIGYRRSNHAPRSASAPSGNAPAPRLG